MNKDECFNFMNKSGGDPPVSKLLENTSLNISTAPFRKFQILLVEDNQSIQFLYNVILTDLDCHVDFASSAKEALSMADNLYDLIILDIGLPDRSGIEVAIELRQRELHKKTRLIAFTAFTKELIQKDCIAAGIELVFTKPVYKKDIEAVIAQTKEKVKIAAACV